MPTINRYIEHTLLKSDTTSHMIHRLCQEAKDHQFLGVCVNPTWVALSKKLLNGSEVKIISVVGFPLGASPTAIKVLETKTAVIDGADEIDLVMSIGKLKSGMTDEVFQDMYEVVKAAGHVPVKVIIETSLLSEDEKSLACQLCEKAGARFVKTSTGYGPSGATVEDILLIKKEVGERLEIKASGGIRDYAKAKALIEAGASRIGSSSGVAILNEERETQR